MQKIRDIPWLRIGAESTVIVASILLAFAIDAWWAGRQDNEDLAALVDLLVADIEADAAELSRRLDRSDMLIGTQTQLLAIGLEAQSFAELTDLITKFTGTSQTDPSLSAYEVVQGSAAWNRIPADVKIAISDYMRGPFAVDRNRDLEALNRLTDLSTTYGGLARWGAQLGTADEVLRYLQDPATQTWISQHRYFLELERAWQARWVERLPTIADQLRSLTF